MTLREHLLTALDHAGDILDVEGMDTRASIHRCVLGALAELNAAERAATWFNGENVEQLRLVPDPERGRPA